MTNDDSVQIAAASPEGPHARYESASTREIMGRGLFPAMAKRRSRARGIGIATGWEIFPLAKL